MLRWQDWRRWRRPFKGTAGAAVLLVLVGIGVQGILGALDVSRGAKRNAAVPPGAGLGEAPPEPEIIVSLARPVPATSASRLSASERDCLASAIYHEARGEPADGQIAVAQVILNRVRSGRWPSTICGVVYQDAQRGEKCQFSFACRRNAAKPKAGDPDWDSALSLAEAVAAGQAPPDQFAGATHYHTVDVHPVWRLALKPLGQVGRHLFYEEGRPGGAATRIALASPGTGAAPSTPRKPRVRAERIATKAASPPSAPTTSDPTRMFSVERN